MSEPAIMLRLFPDWTPIKRVAFFYAARCLAIRLRHFGFESQVNLYSPRELMVLATLLPDYGHANFVKEALDRAEKSADTDLVAYIHEHYEAAA